MIAEVIDHGMWGTVVGVNDHEIQFGGPDGDGFCYSHQSFDCLPLLSNKERMAIDDLEFGPDDDCW